MSRFIQYFWPASNTNAIVSSVNSTGAGNINLNGNYVNNGVANIISHGFARYVSITSANNLSGVTFTVTGTQNGVSITDGPITGPTANNTVQGNKAFDTITSISVSGAANGINIGLGDIGYFPLVLVNLQGSKTNISYALKFNTQDANNGCTYAVYQSLNNVSNNGFTYDQLVTNKLVIQKGNNYASISQILQMNDICNDILVKVTVTPANATLAMQFLQL